MKIYFYSIQPSGQALRDILRSLFHSSLHEREIAVAGKLMRAEEIARSPTNGCRPFEVIRERQGGLFSLGYSGQRVTDLPIGEGQHLFASAAAALKGNLIAIQRVMSVRESMVLEYLNRVATQFQLTPVRLVPEVRPDKLALLRSKRCKGLTFDVSCAKAMSMDAFRNNRVAGVLVDRRALGYGRISVSLRASRGSGLTPAGAVDLARQLLASDGVSKVKAELDATMPNLDLLNAHQHVEVKGKVDEAQYSRRVIGARLDAVVDALNNYTR